MSNVTVDVGLREVAGLVIDKRLMDLRQITLIDCFNSFSLGLTGDLGYQIGAFLPANLSSLLFKVKYNPNFATFILRKLFNPIIQL